MADLAELQKKQADAASFAMRMVEEKDPELLKQMAERLRESCVELANMAKALEAAMTPAGASGPETRGALAPGRREGVAGQSGVGADVRALRESRARPWAKQEACVGPRASVARAAR